jgi:hypothetical protein
MKHPNTQTGQFVTRYSRRALLALLLGVAVGPLAAWTARADDDQAITKMRWDLIHIASFSPVTIQAGGEDSAKANEGSMITLTGSGTFLVRNGAGLPKGVTGGGTWETFDNTGKNTGGGTYKVTSLVSWDNAPGSPGAGAVDKIGDGTLADNRGGLVVLRIEYSDGSKGVLTVSCHQPGAGPPTAPDTVFEGITATKSYVDYWNRVAPVGGVDGNRTLFHVLPGGQDADKD